VLWKVLYDPARFPEWWAGIGTIDPVESAPGDPTSYTMYPAGYPDFPMPQQLRTSHHRKSVVVSCLVSDLRFEWRLEPLDGGRAHAEAWPDVVSPGSWYRGASFRAESRATAHNARALVTAPDG
jgi:hypothetical protein